jgi:hypothetical protein
VLIDRKTGSYSASVREQTAGYLLALPSVDRKPATTERMAVYLRPNGKYTPKLLDDPSDIPSFLSALYVARVRTERKLYFADEYFDRIIERPAEVVREPLSMAAIDWLNNSDNDN